MNDTMEKAWHSLAQLLTSRWYWLALALLGVAMEGVALYYQYAVGDEPCQICIHVRIWVAAFTLLAVVMAVMPRRRWLATSAHVLVLACMIGLWERCKYLLDVEKGLGDSSCQFFLGFPEWFAIDRWLPWLFEVRNLCGPTPMMPFGFSMAQYLMFMSTSLVFLAVAALAVNVLAWRE